MSSYINSPVTNLLVTAVVALLVLVLPWADRKICTRHGLNLHGGVSANPRADLLLSLRQGLLVTGLALYLLVFFWLTFLSRSVMDGYAVHVAPLEDLKNAFETEHGFSDVISRLFTEGFSVFANIRLVRPEDISQFYLNMVFFVPFGYLLPYTFRWFRERVRTRPVGVCFLISFFTENMQLMSQRGLYDLDDMISNSLGGLIGQLLYISFAYVVTHPDWKRDLRSTRYWRKRARNSQEQRPVPQPRADRGQLHRPPRRRPGSCLGFLCAEAGIPSAPPDRGGRRGSAPALPRPEPAAVPLRRGAVPPAGTGAAHPCRGAAGHPGAPAGGGHR